MPPLVVDIRRNALDDGPGIRSTVFFKGCVLRCVWCQNPETISPAPQLQHRAAACISCGRCASACEHGAVVMEQGMRRYDADACEVAGRCTELCPSGALRVVGRAYTVDELVAELLRDEPFFRNSGGGVTLSGGEPTLHLDYVGELARTLHERDIDVLLETCGLYQGERFERELLPYLGQIYFDLKLAAADEHERYTGADNQIIVDNLTRLAEIARDRVLPRIPLVPGITDTSANLDAIADLLLGIGFERVAVLPYNPLWIDKRRDLRMALDYDHGRFMAAAEIERRRARLADRGIALA